MSGLFVNNPYFIELEARTKQLHRLIAEGKCNTEEADAVRDEMDTPWLRLTGAERQRLNGLSADLYMLQNREVSEPSDGRTKIQVGQAIFAAVKQEKWEDALALMRRPNLIPREKIALFRAQSYNNLGLNETSLLFLNYAVERSNEPMLLAGLQLILLYELKRYDELVPLAEQVFTQDRLPAFIRATAAFMLARSAKYMPELQARTMYKRVAEILEQIVNNNSLIPRSKEILSIVHVFIGYCYFNLGQLAPALLSYEHAFQLRKSHELEHLVSLLHQIDLSSPSARDEFAQVVEPNFESLANIIKQINKQPALV